MENRKNKIINYLILLQLFDYKREMTHLFFLKYNDVLGNRIEDTIFDFEKNDRYILKNLSTTIKNNAINTYNEYANNILFFEDKEYPDKLKNVGNFPIILFYKGNINLLKIFSISIVGTRKPSEKAIYDTYRITKLLIDNKVCIVSGLAKGIDVSTHKCCLDKNYDNIIGVIGTSIDKYYPIENKMVQQYVENSGLLIAEYAPFEPTFKWNFTRRNYVMSAISNATIVMQAGDTSGTVSQARSTLKNKRNLYVPASVFDDSNNNWPKKFKNDYGNVFRFEFIEELKEMLKLK